MNETIYELKHPDTYGILIFFIFIFKKSLVSSLEAPWGTWSTCDDSAAVVVSH